MGMSPKALALLLAAVAVGISLIASRLDVAHVGAPDARWQLLDAEFAQSQLDMPDPAEWASVVWTPV